MIITFYILARRGGARRDLTGYNVARQGKDFKSGSYPGFARRRDGCSDFGCNGKERCGMSELVVVGLGLARHGMARQKNASSGSLPGLPEGGTDVLTSVCMAGQGKSGRGWAGREWAR